MKPAEHVQAIVVGVVDYGEADRIARLLTPTHGRVSALARRARSSRKRFGGALDGGNRLEAALRPGGGDLWHLDGAVLVDGRTRARRDLGRLALLCYACELCGALAQQHHPEPRLFGLLDTACLTLDALAGAPSPRFRVALEAKALTFAGVCPALDRCASCGGPAAASNEAWVWGGPPGAFHARCMASGRPVGLDWLQAVEAARRAPLQRAVEAVLPVGPLWVLSEAAEAAAGHALRARALVAETEATGGAAR